MAGTYIFFEQVFSTSESIEPALPGRLLSVKMPLPIYSPCMEENSDISEDELISSYFFQGYTNAEIVEFLKLHGISMSLSTVKRRLRTVGLYRRKQGAPSLSNEDLKKEIEIELGGNGSFVGYRKMWARLKQKGIFVKWERVMHILRSLDPVGVECRKRKRLRGRAYRTKGPNFVWHIDGHDNLKPFGFSIHACIDGFSRRLIWLEVGPTNKDPEVIAKMYLDAVKQIIG